MGACGSKEPPDEGERSTSYVNVWQHVEDPTLETLRAELEDERLSKQELNAKLMELTSVPNPCDHSHQISQIGEILENVHTIEQAIGPEEPPDLMDDIDPSNMEEIQARVTKDHIRKLIKKAVEELRDEVKDAAIRSFQENSPTDWDTKNKIEFKYEFIVKLTKKFDAV